MPRACAICGMAVFVALSAGAALPSARALPDGTSPGRQSIERQLSRGGHHRYEMALPAGEAVHLSVDQKGTDVLVQIRDPVGQVVADVDDQVALHGREEVDLVADRTGVYIFDIGTSPSATSGGAYDVRVDSRGAATDTDRAWQRSRRLRTEAERLAKSGRFEDARPLLEQAMDASTQVRGTADRDVGLLSLQLAYNALAMRDDVRSRRLATDAIDIFERSAGPDDLYAVRARSLLAVLRQHAGEDAQADALLQSSLAVFERTLGPDHPWSIECLITQANIRFDAGDVDAAEALDRRAMAMLEAAGDTQGVAFTALLNNLGEVYHQRGDDTRAEELFLRSLAAAERLEGAQSYRVTTTLQNLGIVARQRGDYARALEYDTRALFRREKLLGPDHADIAPLLNNLAVLYRSAGDEAHALPMLFRALAIRESTVGPYHRGTLNTVGNIARAYASVGDIAHALEFERRADGIVEKQLALNLAVGSERQKLAFVRSVADRTDRAISLNLNLAPADPDAAALAALVLLQRKGRVQDAMGDVFGAMRSRVTRQSDREDMDRLNETRRRLAQVALDGAGGATGRRQQALAALEAEAERLESSLSAHSVAYRAQAQPVSLAAVQEALPPGAVLVEYAVFRPFHPGAPRSVEEYDAPRYAAYVIQRSGAPAGFDLGDAPTIERAVEAMRDAVRDPTSDQREVRTRAAALFDLIVRPLGPALKGAARLVISPDGHLNFVPFEALVGDGGRYLIELYSTSYVTSGRDLLRMHVPRGAPTDPVIVANPRFGVPTPGTHGATGSRPAMRPSVTTGTTLAAAYFSPLAATGSEARAIKALFPAATLLTGAAATKENVRHVRAPRILHIASHAFFLDDTPAGVQTNPLLRSGVALAGANATPDGHANGLLTALEASGLDLWGTELVTLSGCDTGVGEIRNGEGVYGLRRAFVLAGAQSLVMSLWPVSDYVARDTMVAYYTGLRAGLGRGDALRRVKLAMLRSGSRSHPYYWAPFIQSGEWDRLVTVRPGRL